MNENNFLYETKALAFFKWFITHLVAFEYILAKQEPTYN